MIRVATISDLDDLIEIARECYGRDTFNTSASRLWANRAIGNPDGIFIRSDDGFAVAGAQSFPHEPNILRARLIYIASRCKNPWTFDGYRMFLHLVIWAREIGASSFHFGSETGVDFSPFAKRLKACQDTASYSLGL